MLLCFYVNLRCCTTSFMDSLFMRTPIGGMDLRPRERAAGATHVQISWISAWIPSEVTRTFFFDLPIWDSNSSSFSCRSFSSQREPTVVGSISQKLSPWAAEMTPGFAGLIPVRSWILKWGRARLGPVPYFPNMCGWTSGLIFSGGIWLSWQHKNGAAILWLRNSPCKFAHFPRKFYSHVRPAKPLLHAYI